MKNYLHIFIKGAFVLFLIAYLTVLYTSDSAKNVPMEQIAQTMEQDSDITCSPSGSYRFSELSVTIVELSIKVHPIS